MRTEAKEIIDSFLRATENATVAIWATLPRAIVHLSAGALVEYVYVPSIRALKGERDVLLVAHCDTVERIPRGETPGGVGPWQGGMIAAQGYCLGADDRVGVALLWMLRNDPRFSFLLTTGEESGCIGANSAIKTEPWGENPSHVCALEIDRRGDCEIAFYDGGHSEQWESFLVERTGFDVAWGSFTDITVLCEHLGIVGANFSAGYLHEHTRQETFSLDAWKRTQLAIDFVASEVLREPTMKPAYQWRGYRRGDVWGSSGFWRDSDLRALPPVKQESVAFGGDRLPYMHCPNDCPVGDCERGCRSWAFTNEEGNQEVWCGGESKYSECGHHSDEYNECLIECDDSEEYYDDGAISYRVCCHPEHHSGSRVI